MPRAPGTLTTATILFTDIVDSTATRTRLGEELADRHFLNAYRLLQSVATVAGATFTKSLGDGVMAVFDSATAGLDAAIDVQRALIEENERAIEPIVIRAALSVGDVRWDVDDVSGLPTVEGARLVDIALPDQVLCTDLVWRLAQGRGRRDFKDIGRLPAKGLREPLHAYELLWRSAGTDRPARPARWLDDGHLLPLVGREAQLKALDGELTAAEYGTRTVLLRGDPGAGKTRLASVVARWAADRQFTVLTGRCHDPARQAYEPIAEAVEGLASTAPAMLLRAGVDGCGQLVRLAPALAAPPLSLTVPPATEPVSERYQLVSALRRLIELLAAVRPVVLLIDDLHWATVESMRMLRALRWDSATGPPLLILATARPVPAEAGEAAAQLHKLAAESRVVQVGALGPGDVAEALAGKVPTAHRRGDPEGSAATARDGDAGRLHEITGGNAFLVTEVIRELMAGKDLGTMAVPDSVARMVVARLARLQPEARGLANLLAVAERLGSAALRVGVGVDEEEFVTAAEEAVAAGLLTMTPDGQCRFSHELTRQAVYAALSVPRAGLLHGRAADALRQADPTVIESRPYLVAAHLVAAAERAGDPARTTEAAEAAGHAARHALAGLAHREAVSWYERLLDLLDDIPGTSPERRAAALVNCGRAMWLAGDPRARPTLGRAGALARECGRADLVVEAAVAGDRGFFSMTAAVDPERIDLLTEARGLVDQSDLRTKALLTAQLAAELTWAPDGERRFALSDEAVMLARESADPRTLVSVLGLRNLTVVPAESPERRRRDCEEMLAAAERTGDDLALFHATFQCLAPVLDIGDTTLITRYLDRAGELARRLAQPHLNWLVGFSRAGLLLMRGELAEAEEQAGRALELGMEIGGEREAMAFYAEQITEIRRLQGRLAELRDGLHRAGRAALPDPVYAVLRYLCELDDDTAAALLDQALAEHGLIPRRDMAQRPALDNLALAACRLRRADLVRPLYEALAPHADTFGHSAVAHHCGHHYLGHLAALDGDGARSAEHFEAAARLHERRGVPLLLAESLLDWADLAGRVEPIPAPGDLRERCARLLPGRGAALLERRLAR